MKKKMSIVKQPLILLLAIICYFPCNKGMEKNNNQQIARSSTRQTNLTPPTQPISLGTPIPGNSSNRTPKALEEKLKQIMSAVFCNNLNQLQQNCVTFQDLCFVSLLQGIVTPLTLAVERGFFEIATFILKTWETACENHPDNLYLKLYTNDVIKNRTHTYLTNNRPYTLPHRLAASSYITEEQAIRMAKIIASAGGCILTSLCYNSKIYRSYSYNAPLHHPVLIAELRGWHKLAKLWADELLTNNSYSSDYTEIPTHPNSGGDLRLSRIDTLSLAVYNKKVDQLNSAETSKVVRIFKRNLATMVYLFIAQGGKIFDNRNTWHTDHSDNFFPILLKNETISIPFNCDIQDAFKTYYPLEALQRNPIFKAICQTDYPTHIQSAAKETQKMEEDPLPEEKESIFDY